MEALIQPTQSPIDVKGMELATLTQLCIERGHTTYRAEQMFRWIHEKGVRNPDEMTNVPKSLREQSDFVLGGLTLDGVLRSVDGTRKLLLRTAGGLRLESVVIPMGRGRLTQCVSSQIGCKMGCDFCATAEMSTRRNLAPSEIVDQVYHAKAFFAGEGAGEEVDNLVFMGMGEPLDNFDNVVTALRLLMDQKGMAFGQRRVTVSTVGLVPKIAPFGETVPVNLAVSLNATTDEVRSQLMPINRKYPIAVLLEALRTYPMQARRRIFVEYVLLGGVNDTDADARRLPELLADVKAKVNLIPFNPYPGARFTLPREDRVVKFREMLLRAGIQTNVREPKGRDIQAACGMLDGTKPL